MDLTRVNLQKYGEDGSWTKLDDFINLRELVLNQCGVSDIHRFPEGLKVLLIIASEFSTSFHDTDALKPPFPNPGSLLHLAVLNVHSPGNKNRNVVHAFITQMTLHGDKYPDSNRRAERDIKYMTGTAHLQKLLELRGQGLVSLFCDGCDEIIDSLHRYCPSLRYLRIAGTCRIKVKSLIKYMEKAAGKLCKVAIHPCELHDWSDEELSSLQRAAVGVGIELRFVDEGRCAMSKSIDPCLISRGRQSNRSHKR